MLRQMEQQKIQQAQQQAEQQSLAEYRKAQAEQARERSRLYATQVAAQEREVGLKEKALKESEAFLRQIFPQGIGAVQQPQAQPQSAPQPSVGGMFNMADTFVAGIEGGYVPNDGGKGPTNKGINQRANPDVNVRNLTDEAASMLRKQRYWDAIGADQLPAPTAMVAYDAAINQGQQYAKKLLEETGGDPALMLYQREKDYRDLAKSNPIHAKSLKGWLHRLDRLKTQLPSTQAPSTTQPASADGMEPHRALQIAGGLAMRAEKPGEALSTIGQALKPEVATPGSFRIGPGGSMTQIPDPMGERRAQTEQERLNMERTRLGYEQQRIQTEQTRVGMEQTKEQRAATEAERKRTTAEATDYGQVQGTLDSAMQLSQAASAIKNNPALGRVTGRWSILPDAVRTQVDPEAANVKADLDALGSKILLNTITALKALSENGSTGFGQLSNIEGEHLKNSIASLKESQTHEQMKDRLEVVIKSSNRIVDRASEVYETTHGKSPYQGLPMGTRPYRDAKTGEQKLSKDGKPLLKLPNGKLVKVEE